MQVRVSSVLNASADRVWGLLQKPSTLEYVSAGMIRYQAGDALPATWQVGEPINLKPKLFNRIDQGDYFVTFIDIDDSLLTMVTNEHSDAIALWRHTMQVREFSEGHCLYTDEILIKAGSRTLLVSAFAQVFYRHRHRRWKQLLSENQ